MHTYTNKVHKHHHIGGIHKFSDAPKENYQIWTKHLRLIIYKTDIRTLYHEINMIKNVSTYNLYFNKIEN